MNIYKEKGFTSHDVVAKLRGILKTKKIGHTGTLDPDAEGVLPVCVGKATKLCELLLEKSKIYQATFVLGLTTDTQDITGKVIKEANVNVTREDIADELNLTVEEILKIEKYGYDCVSLETKVRSDDESDSSDLGTFIADENAFFEGKVIKDVYLEQLKDIIFNGSAIDEKQKKVLQYRYGFVDGEPKTLEEVGKVFGVTRERIRQIEAKALRALRNSGTLKEFRPEKRDIDKKDSSVTRTYSLALRN